MPSPSPEPPAGNTRDEAVAAARAQYGSDVRIRGVRRIRSGGVAGFFSQERYVADVVLPADTARPISASGSAKAGSPAKAGGSGKASSPTKASGSAKASGSGKGPGRPAVAPARAATPTVVAEAPTAGLTQAEALSQWPTSGLSVDDLLEVALQVRDAQRSADETPTGVLPAIDPVDELADLLGAEGAEPVATYSPTSLARPVAPRRDAPPARRTAPAARPTAPARAPLATRREPEPLAPAAPAWERTSRSGTPAAADSAPTARDGAADDQRADDDAATPPSPFAAALMRVVIQDDEVQAAVADAEQQVDQQLLDQQDQDQQHLDQQDPVQQDLDQQDLHQQHLDQPQDAQHEEQQVTAQQHDETPVASAQAPRSRSAAVRAAALRAEAEAVAAARAGIERAEAAAVAASAPMAALPAGASATRTPEERRAAARARAEARRAAPPAQRSVTPAPEAVEPAPAPSLPAPAAEVAVQAAPVRSTPVVVAQHVVDTAAGEVIWDATSVIELAPRAGMPAAAQRPPAPAVTRTPKPAAAPAATAPAAAAPAAEPAAAPVAAPVAATTKVTAARAGAAALRQAAIRAAGELAERQVSDSRPAPDLLEDFIDPELAAAAAPVAAPAAAPGIPLADRAARLRSVLAAATPVAEQSTGATDADHPARRVLPAVSPAAVEPVPTAEQAAAEQARVEAEQAAAEQARIEAEQAAAEQAAAEQARIEAERAAASRRQAEQLAAQQVAARRLAAEQAAAEQAAAEQAAAEQARLEAERAEARRLAAARSAALEAARTAAVRAAVEREETARVAAERVVAERTRVEAAQVEAMQVEAAQVEAARAAAEAEQSDTEPAQQDGSGSSRRTRAERRAAIEAARRPGHDISTLTTASSPAPAPAAPSTPVVEMAAAEAAAVEVAAVEVLDIEVPDIEVPDIDPLWGTPVRRPATVVADRGADVAADVAAEVDLRGEDGTEGVDSGRHRGAAAHRRPDTTEVPAVRPVDEPAAAAPQLHSVEAVAEDSPTAPGIFAAGSRYDEILFGTRRSATRPTGSEALEALRAAALAGGAAAPRRRRAPDAGRHRTLPTQVDLPAGGAARLTALEEPSDATSGFIGVLQALADSDFASVPTSDAPELAAEVSDVLVQEMAHEMAAGMAEELARTASDPAPLTADATSVLPPLEGLAGASAPRVRGHRPPVPVATTRSRSLPPHPSTRMRGVRGTDDSDGWATITHLVPVADDPAPAEGAAGLAALGVPAALLGADFAAEAGRRGTFAALASALGRALPVAPALPAEPGDVLVVVGNGAEALTAARGLAMALRLDPAAVQWCTRGPLAGLVPADVRVPGAAAATERRAVAASAAVPTVVAVDVPLGDAGGAWAAQMVQAWAGTAVWAVLDSTRKPGALRSWLAGLPRVDAVVVTDTDSAPDPAALLDGLPVPVAVVDGARATPHRWAALLCERLAGRR